MAFFNEENLPNPGKAYVCFLDIMGMQNKMKRSVSQSANYMFKLHATILSAWRTSGYENISVYPIMDGAYIVSPQKENLMKLLTNIMQSLTEDLLAAKFSYWFLVRGAISFGEVIHGRDIPYNASLEFSSRVGYKEQLLIGPAMIDAYKGEHNAAPMGIYICESAFQRLRGIPQNWKWQGNPKIKIKVEMSKFQKKLKEYYTDWLTKDDNGDGYDDERRLKHFEQIRCYFDF